MFVPAAALPVSCWMEPIASGVPVGWAPPAAVVAEDPDPDVPVEPVVVGVLLFVELEPHAAATTAKPHNKAGSPFR